MVNGLRINGVDNNRMFTKNIDLDVGGVDFYSGNAGGAPHEREAYQWIHCIIDDTDPLVLPEQAYVVTQILEGIYESAKTGKAVYFN